ncbi:hypothetical protein D6D11_04213 [Aureobasidium pullulans]|nr:hypothetical protein D6D11_04213 [Aureobasidium pullulans]
MTQSTKQKGTMESTNTHRSELDIKSGMPAKSDFGPTTTHDLSETRIAMPFHIFALVANGSNEDNVINARILSKQLRAKGHQVHVAIHGQEALDYLRTTKYSRGSDSNAVELDVILMDWEMPVLNGIDCTKQIRQLEAQGSLTTHLPIIVTSANARPEQIEVAYAAGTDEFLSKPFTVTQVLEKIRQMND